MEMLAALGARTSTVEAPGAGRAAPAVESPRAPAIVFAASFPARLECVGHAGAAMHALRWAVGDRADDLALLVLEVMGNAVRHGGGGPEATVALEVGLRDGTLRAQVRDRGPGFSPPATLAPPAPEATHGRGLVIVDRVSDRWGVLRDEDRGTTTVWFEIARAAALRAAA